MSFFSKQISQRETLYTEFINEAARLSIESLDSQMEKASGMVTIYALHNRIRLNASEEVLQAADHAIANIVQSYKRQNLTSEDIRSGAFLDIEDPLKEFGQACPNELNKLYSSAT